VFILIVMSSNASHHHKLASCGIQTKLFGGKRTQINLRAMEQHPINRAFSAQNRIYPVLFCSPAIYRWAVTAHCDLREISNAWMSEPDVIVTEANEIRRSASATTRAKP
jgi:hypothetical protein